METLEPRDQIEAEPRKEEDATVGLNPQDEDRARSMADEGGASGMTVEAQPPLPLARGGRGWAPLTVALAAAAGVLAGALWVRHRG
jgi:hypothetical protein